MYHAQAVVKTAVKSALLVCAAAVCVLRFISFRYRAALPPRADRALLLASAVCGALSLLLAAAWIVLEKKGKNGT